MMLCHLQDLAELKGSYAAVREMRKHVGHYISGLRGATAIRRQVNFATTLEELTALLEGLRTIVKE